MVWAVLVYCWTRSFAECLSACKRLGCPTLFHSNSMEDKQPKSRPGRHFHFTKEATYIEKQEITVQSGANFYNGPSAKNEEQREVENRNTLLTDRELRERINMVMPQIKKNRYWFCILKVLMLEGQLTDGDFAKGEKLIQRLYPAGVPNMFDPDDVARLHVGSFRLPVSKWVLSDSPFERSAEFKIYKKLAEDFQKLFEQE